MGRDIILVDKDRSVIRLTLNIGREGGGIIPADKVRSGIKLLSAEGLNRVK